jgi:DNA-binding response OmpR family regulator
MKKILIIEDDQIIANIYSNKLTVDGYRVEIAYDGESGFDTLKSFRPDAVLLDLMLPRLSGVDLIKRIRSESDFEQLPLIVISSTYLTNMVQEAWKAGATKCLSKTNCTPKHVIEVIRGVVGSNGALPAAENRVGAPVANPPTAGAEAPANDSDSEFQADLRKSFIDSLPATLAALRTSLQGTVKADSEEDRLKQLQELYRRVHALTGNAAITGLLQIAQMADALETLLKELYEKPQNITTSTLRTVASAVDLLGILFQQSAPSEQEIPIPRILVVDDEDISRRAMTYALEKAKLKAVTTADPLRAFQMLTEHEFDLVLLDVDMPNMNGFELCSKLRALPTHKKTPVVFFVTSLNDFENRANSTMSGGNEFIGKPFLFMELAVKSLACVLRTQLDVAGKRA